MRLRKGSFAHTCAATAGAVVLFAAGSAKAAQYSGGSLIIPMQSVFQNNCGVVSAYGLVYDILRANDGLAAAGKPRIVVHWAYKGTKASPNRCVPTDQSRPPPYGSYSAGNPPPWNDPIWNDGCDFRVTDSSSLPVTQIDNTTGDPARDTLITTINTTADTTVSPTYPSVTITQVGTTKVTSVGYLGGPFVIAASDVPVFLQLLTGQLVVNDAQNNPVDFTAFRTPGSCTSLGATHFVAIHRALTSFTADDNLSFNQTPPRAALLDTGLNVSGGILNTYLANAGLVFTGSFGCPPGGVNSTNTVKCPTGKPGIIFDYFDLLDLTNNLMALTDSKGKPLYRAVWTPHWEVGSVQLTPPKGITVVQAAPGTLTAGTYYYRVTALSGVGETLPSSPESVSPATTGNHALTITWPAVPNAVSYNVYGRTAGAEKLIASVDAPAVTYTDTGAITPSGAMPTTDTSASPPPNIIAAMGNVAAFLSSGQTGLMAECASIQTFEGETSSSSAATQDTQFMTCKADAVNKGACSSTASTPYGLTKDIAGPPTKIYLPNCTDPTAAAASSCAYFPNPGDSFMQFGDYRWFAQSGLVSNYIPASGQIFEPGTVPLAYVVTKLDKTKLGSVSSALTMPGAFISSRALKDGNPAQGNILYLGGHTYDVYASGNRVVLGTLLQLGLVYSTAETGNVGPTAYNNSVFVPTYDRILSTPTSSAVKKFDPLAGSQFLFPYHSGHLKTHSLTGSGSLAQGNNSFSSNVQWDAQTAMPAPDKRNLFTYVGGYLSVPASNVAKQAGWAPADLDYTSIQSPISTCTDNWSLGRISKDATRNKPGPYAGMTVGPNGVCDVEELLAANLVLNASDFGSDQGASAAEQTAIVNKLQSTAVNGGLQVTRQLTQLVRGYCFATVGAKDGAGAMVNNPTSTQCNYKRQDNVNSVGGFVHSQAAVIPPSASVLDSPNGKHRPTVAYVGGLDGQLHAFYVPGPDTNDAGYAGPANALHLPFTAAKTTFHTDWLGSGSFSPPAPLTELWSFVPPGQAPFLYSNDAMVDASPAVLDIFADLDGDGIREWHTVLVASAGGSNREIFALDVSNPLAPALLWDIQSSFDSTSIPYAPVPLMDDDTGKALVSGEQAFLWQNHCRAAAVTASTCTAATYALPPLADAGRSTTGLFNYQHLGASQSVQAALLRRNNAPVYAAFVSTNEPGGSGMYLFAIDISTGQKIWEFANPYDKASDPPGMSDGVDNSTPAGVSLFSKVGTSLIDTVYAGDLEGSLWELDASDGTNLTSYAQQLGTACTGAGNCNFSLSNAYGYDPNGYPQPITTLSTIFNVPANLTSTSAFSSYAGQTLLAYGTAGTDKVSSLPYTVTGSVHVLPLLASGRLSPADVAGPPSQFSTASTRGVAREATGYPQYVATGERLFGSITADGTHLFFATTSGAATNIDSRGTLGGSTYSLDLNASLQSGRSALTTTAGGAGGTVLAVTNSSGQTQVITVTNQTINVSAPQTADKIQPPGINGAGKFGAGLVGWFLKQTGHEY